MEQRSIGFIKLPGGPRVKKFENPQFPEGNEANGHLPSAWAEPTLVVQLEGPEAVVLEGPEVDRDGVGGASDDLPLHQERLVGQDGQRGAVHPADGQQLPLRQVDTLHLGVVGGGWGGGQRETESRLSHGKGTYPDL